MQEYGGSVSSKTGDFRSSVFDSDQIARADLQNHSSSGSGSQQQLKRTENTAGMNYSGSNQHPYNAAMMQQKNYGCSSKELSDQNYCRVTGLYESGMSSSHFQPPRYANQSAPTFSSPPNSPLVGLVFDPTSPNYVGSPMPLGNDHRSQNSWPISNPDQILPIGTGAKKKIIKTQPDKRSYYSSDQRNQHQERFVTSNEINEDNANGRKIGGTLTSESVSSLDFLVEGERMVSELCNISEMSTRDTIQKHGTKPYCYVVTKESESMEKFLNSLDKIIIHDQIPNEIVQLAIEACTDAENIAIAHHNRPCFKNIHSICAKTRSNVQKPDSAVANLHSQGIPWVIKNFIFSFVRILDGWKGVKELLCEKHDTFSRIENKYYSPNIRECFVQWQAVTKEMLSHIYKTFKCLDHGFTMEQKSFTHNYYATNPAAPRHQNPSKFQPPKGNMHGPRPVNVTPQSYSAPAGHWMQSTVQSGSQGYSDPSWPSRSAVGCKKFSSVIPPNSHNFYNMTDQNDVETCHHKSQYKCEPAPARETKPRQSWTITNLHDLRTVDSMCQADQRDLYSQLKNKVDAELGRGSCQALLNTVSNEIIHRRDMEIKAKMIPVSHVEKNLIPSMGSSADGRTCFGQKNNSCGDTKEDADFFTNWGQMLQKEPSEFVAQQPHNIQVPSNVVSFSTNIAGPVKLIDPDNDDFHDMSKVYMKPGSYKVPIKPADTVPSFAHCSSSQDPMPIYENTGVEEVAELQIKIPFCPAPAVPQPKYPIEPWPCLLSKRQDDISFSDDRKGAARLPRLDPRRVTQGGAELLTRPPSDRAWEAAKQSAPKLMDFIHEGSKSDTARLYDALGLSTGPDECSKDLKQQKVCLKKEDVWLENTHTIPIDVSDTKCQQINLKICKTETPERNPGTIEIKNISAENEEITKHSNENSKLTEEQTADCEITEFSEGIKRTDKNPNQTKCENRCLNVVATGTWYHPKKKKPIPANMSKKFEHILCSLSKLPESTFIQYDMDMKAAPRFYEVVKYPMCLNDITTKLKNFTYTDSEQVVQDFRRIFNNIRLYLTTYPDTTMKKNLNKMSTEFEKMFAEAFERCDPKAGMCKSLNIPANVDEKYKEKCAESLDHKESGNISEKVTKQSESKIN